MRQTPRPLAQAEEDLRQTAITQPAVLATDLALTRLLDAYGIQPDMTMGHSLGEYGALGASGALPFADALEAVAARGREMTRVSMADNGRMAAVFAPLDGDRTHLEDHRWLCGRRQYQQQQAGSDRRRSSAVDLAVAMFLKAGYNAVPLTVSHAFHTSIVAPASEPLRQVLERLRLEPPHVPIVANVDGEFYPMGPDVVPAMLDILARQVAAPVQFIKGLRTLYHAGRARLRGSRPQESAAGLRRRGARRPQRRTRAVHQPSEIRGRRGIQPGAVRPVLRGLGGGEIRRAAASSDRSAQPQRPFRTVGFGTAGAVLQGDRYADRYSELGRLFADILDRGWQIYHGGTRRPAHPVAIMVPPGTAGNGRIFDDSNVARILRGEQFIDAIPMRFRRAMLDKHITRLVKNDNGGPSFEPIQQSRQT